MMDDYPRLEFANQKVVKVRKEHRCKICTRIIKVGEYAIKDTVMTSDDDKPGTIYYCKERCV